MLGTGQGEQPAPGQGCLRRHLIFGFSFQPSTPASSSVGPHSLNAPVLLHPPPHTHSPQPDCRQELEWRLQA